MSILAGREERHVGHEALIVEFFQHEYLAVGGRAEHRREHGRTEIRNLQPEVADAVAEGLESLLRPAQPAHELGVVGEKLDESASCSDATGRGHSLRFFFAEMM